MQTAEKLTPWKRHGEPYGEFVHFFPSRQGRYITKGIHGRRWKTSSYDFMPDKVLQAHLDGVYIVGTGARHISKYTDSDYDGMTLNEAQEIREKSGADEYNSILYANNERDNCYRLLTGAPVLNGEPVPTHTFSSLIQQFKHDNGIDEIYPHPRKKTRLPFSPHSSLLDPDYAHLTDWKDRVSAFRRLGEFDVSSIASYQTDAFIENAVEVSQMASERVSERAKPFSLREAKDLEENGLRAKGTREAAQFMLIRYYHRQNLTQHATIERVCKWINEKHNGYSRDIKNRRPYVRNHIKQQARDYYAWAQQQGYYPDDVHNDFNGYLPKSDLIEIIDICSASLPKIKLLYHIVKYCYPRKFRERIEIPASYYKRWADRRTYNKYLAEFQQMGIIDRSEDYVRPIRDKHGEIIEQGACKTLKINWNFKPLTAENSISIDGRALDTFADAVAVTFEPRDFRSVLTSGGASRSAASHYTKRILSETKVQKQNVDKMSPQ